MPNHAPRPGSDEEWEALLRQFRLPPGTQPRPFFYARVQARLAGNQAATWPGLPGWVRRPAFVVMLGALVLAVSGDGADLRPAVAAAAQPGAAQLPR